MAKRILLLAALIGLVFSGPASAIIQDVELMVLEGNLARAVQKHGEFHAETANALIELARAVHERGQMTKAEGYWSRAVRSLDGATPRDHWKLSAACADLSAARTALGDHDGAVAPYAKLIEIYERELGPTHVRLGSEYLLYSEILRRAGRVEEADAAASRGHEIYAMNPPQQAAPPPPKGD